MGHYIVLVYKIIMFCTGLLRSLFIMKCHAYSTAQPNEKL